MARARGYKTGGYWIAFLSPVLAWIVIVVALVAVVAATGSGDGSIKPDQALASFRAGSASAPTTPSKTSTTTLGPAQPPRPSDLQTDGANGECQSTPAPDASRAEVFAALWSEYRAAVDQHNAKCGSEFYHGQFLYLMTPRNEIIQTPGGATRPGSAIAQIPGTTLVGEPTFKEPFTKNFSFEADYTCQQPDGKTFQQYMLIEWDKDAGWGILIMGFATAPS
jgi:hypothetical protein